MNNTNKTTESPSNTKKFFMGCLPLLIILFAGIYAITTLDPPTKRYELPDHSMAYATLCSMMEGNVEYEKSGFNELDCPFADYQHDYLNDSTYLIMSHFDYKNNYGVKKRYNYKSRIKWLGGDPSSKNNWQMLYIEEYNNGI